MEYKFTASETFWANFYALDERQKQLAREKWEIFKLDPFDSRLDTHKINRLTSIHRTTVRSVTIEKNLKIVFKIVNSNEVHTIDIGTHDIYK